MNIRPGRVDDAEAIASLIDSFRGELLDAPGGEGAEPYLASVSPEAEAGYLRSDRYTSLVAERDGAMLGVITRRDVSHVFHLFVARGQQRQGIARRLWHETKQQALAEGEPKVFTVNSSLAAVAVYRSFGFEPAGSRVSMHGVSFLPMRLDVGQASAVFHAVRNLIKPMDSVVWLGAKRRRSPFYGEHLQRRQAAEDMVLCSA